MNNVVKTIDFIIDKALFIFFLLIMLIGCYTLYDTVLVYNKSDNSDLRTYKPIVNDGKAEWDMSTLSDDVVAWLTIDDTKIDYPVMQGNDNTEYLNRDPYGNYAVSGSLFLDARNTRDFSDEYSLIYGHHMEFGYMFGALDKFLDEEYFEGHRTGTLVVDQNVYKIKLFACLEADSSVDEIFVPNSKQDALSYIEQHASVYNVPDEGRLIGMSTCKHPETTERIIVFGVIYNA